MIYPNWRYLNVKGVILAGGTGTRLGLLTKTVNKHLLPIYNRPMILYPLSTLIDMDIKSIMVVTDRRRAGDFMNLLGSGKDFGVRFTYGLQDEAAGIADAISVTRDFAAGDDITVILGDNIFLGTPTTVTDHERNARVFLKKVKDPQRFGVAILKNSKISEIIEKPQNNFSHYAVTGLYQYPSDVFDFIERISPSQRDELEVTELNRMFLKYGRLDYEIIEGDWIDAGTVESLFEAQELVRRNTLPRAKLGKS